MTNIDVAGELDALLGLAAFFVLALCYMLPFLIAAVRGHHRVGSIAVLNFLLGWTFLGWVVALALAASAKRPPPAPYGR